MMNYEKEKYDMGVKLARNMSDALNTSGMSGQKPLTDGFISTLQKDHRSLQYDEIILMVKAICAFSDCGTDARNENAVKLARFIKKAVEEKYDCPIEYLN